MIAIFKKTFLYGNIELEIPGYKVKTGKHLFAIARDKNNINHFIHDAGDHWALINIRNGTATEVIVKKP